MKTSFILFNPFSNEATELCQTAIAHKHTGSRLILGAAPSFVLLFGEIKNTQYKSLNENERKTCMCV